jgi:hypothetical protein
MQFLDSKIQIISIAASALFLFIVIEAVRRRRLKEAYSLLWLLLGGSFLTLAIWRSGLEYFAHLAGIYYAPSALFLFMLCSLFLILFQYSILLTRRSDDVRRLAQDLALAEERIRKLEERVKNEDKPAQTQ